MDLLWSKGDEGQDPSDRALRRNYGSLFGDLSSLLPFIYFAHIGATGRQLRAHHTASHQGLFTVCERTGGQRPGLSPRHGLIMPFALCRDDDSRSALLALQTTLDDVIDAPAAIKRRAVQTSLDEAFGGALIIDRDEIIDRFFALKPGPGLFDRLQAFDYITDVVDNPASTVQIVRTAQFSWRSYGELMEWYYRNPAEARTGEWSPLVPFLVFGNTAAMARYRTERWARKGLVRPAEQPTKWFVLRPDISNAELALKIEMHEYGWAQLQIMLDDVTASIQLSDVFDPFDDLVAWGYEVDQGDLPVEMEIDEEGEEAVLTVLPTNDPERVLFRVARKYQDQFLLEGIVARAQLAAAFKEELRRFFTEEFDPQHWNRRDGDDDDRPYQSKTDSVLQHVWMAS